MMFTASVATLLLCVTGVAYTATIPQFLSFYSEIPPANYEQNWTEMTEAHKNTWGKNYYNLNDMSGIEALKHICDNSTHRSCMARTAQQDIMAHSAGLAMTCGIFEDLSPIWDAPESELQRRRKKRSSEYEGKSSCAGGLSEYIIPDAYLDDEPVQLVFDESEHLFQTFWLRECDGTSSIGHLTCKPEYFKMKAAIYDHNYDIIIRNVYIAATCTHQS